MGVSSAIRRFSRKISSGSRAVFSAWRSSRSLRRSGTAAYDLCCVASGRSDAFLELGLNLYDYAAGCVILTEAGGTVSGWEDGEDGLSTGNVIATNGILHEQIRDLLRG